MPTDLFFSQPVSPNPPPAIQSGKLEPSGLNQSSGTQTSSQLPEGDRDNFLATLKEVSHNQTPTKLPQDNDGTLSSDSAVSDGGGEIDETTDQAVATAGITTQNKQDTEPVQIPTDWNFAAFIKVLEGLGLHDAIGGPDAQNLANANPVDDNQLAAIKMLIARLQHNQSAPNADLQESLQRLQQFIANAREGKVQMPIDGALRQGLSPNQVTGPDQRNQWLGAGSEKSMAKRLHHRPAGTKGKFWIADGAGCCRCETFRDDAGRNRSCRPVAVGKPNPGGSETFSDDAGRNRSCRPVAVGKPKPGGSETFSDDAGRNRSCRPTG